MFHWPEINTDKEWVIKMESDMLILKHMNAFEDFMKDDIDLFIEPENRKIFDSMTEDRLWRLMYRSMEIKKPEQQAYW